MKKTNTKGATKPSYSWLTNELEMAGLTGRVLDYLKNPKGLLKNIGLYEFLRIWEEIGKTFESSKAFKANKDLMLKEMYLLCDDKVALTEKGDQTIGAFVRKFGSAKYAINFSKDDYWKLSALLQRDDFANTEKVVVLDLMISHFTLHSHSCGEYKNLSTWRESGVCTKAQQETINFIIDEYAAKHPSDYHEFISENMPERRKTNLLWLLSNNSKSFDEYFSPAYEVALKTLFITKDSRFADAIVDLIKKSEVKPVRQESLYYKVYESSGRFASDNSLEISGNESLQKLLFPVTKEIVDRMDGTEDGGGWIKEKIYSFFNALSVVDTIGIMKKMNEIIAAFKYSKMKYCIQYFAYDSNIKWVDLALDDISASKSSSLTEALSLHKLVVTKAISDTRIMSIIMIVLIPKLTRIESSWVDWFEYDALFPSSGLAKALREQAAIILGKSPNMHVLEIAKYL